MLIQFFAVSFAEFSKSKRKHLSLTGIESFIKAQEMTIHVFDHIYEPINPRPLKECLDER